MTGRDVLTDADAALFAALGHLLRTVDPTPDQIYEQARRAHQHRQGAAVALPARLPSRAAVLNSTAPLGHQTADGACRGGGVPSAAQTTPAVGETATGVEAAGAGELGSPGWNPVKSATAPASLLPPRFLRRIQVGTADECWPWTGELTAKGYGRHCTWGGGKVQKRHRAHRLAYELLVGPIPDGLVLDHLCRNRACCNPAHLEPVTNRENILRGTSPAARAAAASHCPVGHPFDDANTIAGRQPGWRRCRACADASYARQLTRLRARRRN